MARAKTLFEQSQRLLRIAQVGESNRRGQAGRAAHLDLAQRGLFLAVARVRFGE